MRLAFTGTPAAAVPSLRRLLESGRHEVVAVITRPRSRAGRGRREVTSPVEELAREAGLRVLSPPKAGDPEFLGTLTALGVECAPVVAYGALLPPSALAVPTHGWVNLHFSLLPAWRGAAPVQHAILAGDDVTGASTFRIEAGLDTGPIFGVVTEPVLPTDTTGDLLARLAMSGANLLAATMDGISDGSLVPRPQPADGVSVAAKIAVADARVPWSSPALHVHRLVRACTPAPGAWTMFRGDRLKVGPLRLADAALDPGELLIGAGAVMVGTATCAVELGWVHPPGRRAVPAADWARGARPQPGERLG
ncbi:MAG: methionyl-tRNA formyltransferase [Actinomycetota bacterium]